MKEIFCLSSKYGSNQKIGSRFAWQKKRGHLLAVVGVDNTLNIHDKQGDGVDSINLPGKCLAMDWDFDGSFVAMIIEFHSLVMIYDVSIKKVSRIETGFKEGLSTLVWSTSSSLMAIGSMKGNLCIYDHENRTKVPIIGKHTKKISAGVWNKNNSLLALVADDKVVTVSTKEGETVLEVPLNGMGSKLKFVVFHGDGVNNNVYTRRGSINPVASGTSTPTSGHENCVCVLINSKAFMFIPTNSDQVTQLNVSEDRGVGNVLDYVIVKRSNHNLNFMLIGFVSGSFLAISMASDTFGQEFFNFSVSTRNAISTFAVNLIVNKMVTINENVIRVFDFSSDFSSQEIVDVIKIDDETSLGTVEFTSDGSMMAVNSVQSGTIRGFLIQMPVIGSAFGSKIAFLTNLTEISVLDIDNNQNDGRNDDITPIKIDVEPAMIGVGPFHVSAVMNNKAWFHCINDGGSLVRTFEYVSIVTDIAMNGDYAAALFTDGRINLHVIDVNDNIGGHSDLGHGDDDRESKIIEEKGRKGTKITKILMTTNFLIHSSTSGTIEHFFLEDWSTVNVHRHEHGVKDMACDNIGVHVCFIDDIDSVHVYDSVSDTKLDVECENWTPKRIFWDQFIDDDDVTSGVFVIIDDVLNVHTFNYVPETIEGPKINAIDGNKDKDMKLIKDYKPLTLINGVLNCLTPSGKLASLTLPSFEYIDNLNVSNMDTIRRHVSTCLKLCRYRDAIDICERLESDISSDVSNVSTVRGAKRVISEVDINNMYKMIAKVALYNLAMDIASDICTKIEDVGMKYSLKSITKIEEKNLLFGNISLILENYDLAQTLFLASSKPEEALKMRQCLQDWEASLVLASRLARAQVPFICKERAVQLELFSNDHHDALDHYERAIVDNGSRDGASDKIRKHNKECLSGIARNSIRVGNVRRGVEICQNLKDGDLSLECASLLESLKLYNDAAMLFEEAGNVEKSASLFVKVKNIDKVGDLIDKIRNKQTLTEYAKHQENDHKYRDAVIGYKKAGEMMSVVRILLDDLKNPGEAVRIVKEIKSIEGAKMVAKFFQKMGDMTSAIEFLILSQCFDDAFQVASSTGQMDTYSNVLYQYYKDLDIVNARDTNNDNRSTGGDKKMDAADKKVGVGTEKVILKHFNSIAIYYEQSKIPLLAGKFFCLSHNYKKGIKMLLQSINTSPENESEAIQLAIDFTAKSREESVIRTLIDFLIGDVDGVPKDFKYLFRLYMKLGHFKEAAKTALIIAREEQNSGNYRNAHSLLFEMCKELKKNEIQIPNEMSANLYLLHSYLLAKIWIKIGDHDKGASLLIRVSDNISKFPSHTVPILTSAVVECSRAGFKKEAFELATNLMKPENRDKIDPKLRRKIETLVRKSAVGVRQKMVNTDNDNEDDAQDNGRGGTTPCPYCSKPLSVMTLTCSACKNNVPLCLASGQHVTKHDLTSCPSCNFPAIQTHFERLLINNPDGSYCPMCLEDVSKGSLEPRVDLE